MNPREDHGKTVKHSNKSNKKASKKKKCKTGMEDAAVTVSELSIEIEKTAILKDVKAMHKKIDRATAYKEAIRKCGQLCCENDKSKWPHTLTSYEEKLKHYVEEYEKMILERNEEAATEIKHKIFTEVYDEFQVHNHLMKFYNLIPSEFLKLTPDMIRNENISVKDLLNESDDCEKLNILIHRSPPSLYQDKPFEETDEDLNEAAGYSIVTLPSPTNRAVSDEHWKLEGPPSLSEYQRDCSNEEQHVIIQKPMSALSLSNSNDKTRMEQSQIISENPIQDTTNQGEDDAIF